MARMLVSEYASICLNEGIHNYIPILVFLKDEGFRVEYHQYSLDNLLENIISPKNNKEARYRKILLILDGLDEYGKNTDKQQSPALIQKLEELSVKYPNIKIIITTRLVSVLEIVTICLLISSRFKKSVEIMITLNIPNVLIRTTINSFFMLQNVNYFICYSALINNTSSYYYFIKVLSYIWFTQKIINWSHAR